jgi:predicted O-methyltransferase YrrM
MLDDKVLAVMRRLEEEDRLEREQGLPSAQRARAIAPTTGRFLFGLVAHHPGCDVLEIGGSRGYSTLWLGAGVRYLGGRVVSLENDPAKIEVRRANIAEAGLDEWVELVDGDAFEILPTLAEAFDIVFLDAEKDDYERLFQLAREKVEPGGVFVADNVLSHEETLGAYSRARQDDPTLVSVTIPLDRGLELSTVLSDTKPS